MYVHVRRYGLHYNVSMMSFLQEVKELMNKIYFPGGKPVSTRNFRFIMRMVDIHMAYIMYCQE